MVDFGGWDMPVHYGSQIEEHHAVRRDAGMFDVSHMLIADVSGARARDYLRYLLANDVAKLKDPGKALYSCMLNERGGVVDDLITYFGDNEHFRVVVNAGTRDKDTAWLKRWAGPFQVDIQPRTDLAMVAVQGPNARAKAAKVIGKSAEAVLGMKPFFSRQLDRHFVATTGYTGEDGWEVILPARDIAAFWAALRDAGVQQCGLGARDTLRLEMRYALYGNDIDDTTNALEAGLGWVVKPAKGEFIGREALEKVRAEGLRRRLVGIEMVDKAVARHGYPIKKDGRAVGIVTSGSYGPSVDKYIGIAYVETALAAVGTALEVEIRGQDKAAQIVRTPFHASKVKKPG
jgi:aminomethyltransferase